MKEDIEIKRQAALNRIFKQFVSPTIIFEKIDELTRYARKMKESGSSPCYIATKDLILLLELIEYYKLGFTD